jgi:hypothetical protein
VKSISPTVSVFESVRLVSCVANANSFQETWNAKMAAETKPDLASGDSISQNASQWLQLSTIPASNNR